MITTNHDQAAQQIDDMARMFYDLGLQHGTRKTMNHVWRSVGYVAAVLLFWVCLDDWIVAWNCIGIGMIVELVRAHMRIRHPAPRQFGVVTRIERHSQLFVPVPGRIDLDRRAMS